MRISDGTFFPCGFQIVSSPQIIQRVLGPPGQDTTRRNEAPNSANLVLFLLNRHTIPLKQWSKTYRHGKFHRSRHDMPDAGCEAERLAPVCSFSRNAIAAIA